MFTICGIETCVANVNENLLFFFRFVFFVDFRKIVQTLKLVNFLTKYSFYFIIHLQIIELGARTSVYILRKVANNAIILNPVTKVQTKRISLC